MIQNRIGFSFAPPIFLVSILFSAIGLFLCFSEPIVGVIMLIVSAFFWSSSYGIEVDIQKNKFREFSSAYGLKRGKWKPLDKLPFISIMGISEGMAVYSRSNRRTVSVKNKVGVFLLTNSHRTKVLVQKFDGTEKAKWYAASLSKRLKKEIVQYSPVMSQKTRARRR